MIISHIQRNSYLWFGKNIWEQKYGTLLCCWAWCKRI